MSSSHDALLLRIELKDFKPAIYREVLVDPEITLRALHTVIQAAMGWENAHLYAFAQPLRAEFSGTQLRLVSADGARWTFDSQDVPTSAGRERIVLVSGERKPCSGAGAMLCLQVRTEPGAPWQNYYGEIEGFSWQQGVDYVRRSIAETGMPGVDPVPGWLHVSKTDNGNEIRAAVERLRWIGVDVEMCDEPETRTGKHQDLFFFELHFQRRNFFRSNSNKNHVGMRPLDLIA